jgi:hypothetical protein
MIDVTVDETEGAEVAVKLQAETWELNFWAPADELVGLRRIDDADWSERRSLAIGTCAGAPVFWAKGEGTVAILIGEDDETWDVGVTVPPAVIWEIVSQAEQHR